MSYSRVLTGFSMFFLLLALLFFANWPVFVLSCSLLCLLAISEWATLLKLSFLTKIIYMTVIVFVMAVVLSVRFGNFFTYNDLVMPYLNEAIDLFDFIVMSIMANAKFLIGIWFIIVIGLFLYPKSSKFLSKGILIPMVSIITLQCWFHFLWLYFVYTPFSLLMLVLIVSITDSSAYFVGKAIGRHKLCKSLSPKKTIEGAIAGIIIPVSLYLLYLWIARYFHFELPDSVLLFDLGLSYWKSLIVIVLISFASIIGDLFVSMIKRTMQAKDSGWFLPGHGGILDRIDSYLPAAPFFVYLLSII